MIEYFKIYKVYKVEMSTHIQNELPVTGPNFGENMSKVKVTQVHNVYRKNAP